MIDSVSDGRVEILRVAHVPVTPDLSVIRLAGELDLSGVEMARTAIAEGRRVGAPTVAVDMRELEFIDSSGIWLLFSASERAETEGRRMVLVGPAGAVARALSLVGLVDHLDVVEDLDQLADRPYEPA